jgi:hypothetical protein
MQSNKKIIEINLKNITDDDIKYVKKMNYTDVGNSMYLNLVEQLKFEPYPSFDGCNKKDIRKEHIKYYKKCLIIGCIFDHHRDIAFKRLHEYSGGTIVNNVNQIKNTNPIKNNTINISHNQIINFENMQADDLQKMDFSNPSIIEQLNIESFVFFMGKITNDKQYKKCMNYIMKNRLADMINELHREKTFEELRHNLNI